MNKTLIIKIGGSVQKSPEILLRILKDVKSIKESGSYNIVLVHGGGADIDLLCEKLHIPQEKQNGLRVTNAATLEIVQMVLMGKINPQITAILNAMSVHAVGLSGTDSAFLDVEKYMDKSGVDYGYVGSVKSINTHLLTILFKENIVPVICPLACDKNGQAYNINGDIMAGSIAGAIPNSSLIILSDTNGIYREIGNINSKINNLSLTEARILLESDTISHGMIPKLSACISALNHGVPDVYLINGKNEGSLVKLIKNKNLNECTYLHAR